MCDLVCPGVEELGLRPDLAAALKQVGITNFRDMLSEINLIVKGLSGLQSAEIGQALRNNGILFPIE